MQARRVRRAARALLVTQETFLRTSKPILAGIALALCAVVTTAAAEDAAQAEKMFTDAKALLAAGKLAEACDAFAASQKLESSPSTLMNLGDCRQKNGQSRVQRSPGSADLLIVRDR